MHGWLRHGRHRYGIGRGLLPRQVDAEPGAATGPPSTAICPPDWAMMPCTVARPSPVPPFSGRVVKNGSNNRGRASGGMPQPVSDTSSTA
jgi:hypothetical protein